MKAFRSIATFMLLSYTIIGYTQDFEVPKNVELKTEKDYVKYEKDIIAAAKWLVETPLDEQVDKRGEVSAFVFGWVFGSPTVSISLNEIITEFSEKNSAMLIIYAASYSRYVLEHNYSTDSRAAKKAALDDLIKVYESGKGIKKDNKMLQLIEAKKDGKLDEWIDENLPD